MKRACLYVVEREGGRRLWTLPPPSAAREKADEDGGGQDRQEGRDGIDDEDDGQDDGRAEAEWLHVSNDLI